MGRKMIKPDDSTDAATAVTSPPPSTAGSVVLRGEPVNLETEVGRQFVTDCCRNLEKLLSDKEVQQKWGLSDATWAGLASNTSLLTAVRAERTRRVHSGEAVREASQYQLLRAPNVLGGILTDENTAPRHRIEAAKELRQAAGDAVEAMNEKEKFTLIINLGGDEKIVLERAAPKIVSPEQGGSDEPI
jgi:hypothetical protein